MVVELQWEELQTQTTAKIVKTTTTEEPGGHMKEEALCENQSGLLDFEGGSRSLSINWCPEPDLDPDVATDPDPDPDPDPHPNLDPETGIRIQTWIQNQIQTQPVRGCEDPGGPGLGDPGGGSTGLVFKIRYC